LNQCDEACKAIEDLNSLKGGTLIIGASQTTGTYLMPRMIGIFRQKYPDVSVQLQVHSTRRTGWSVANGQIDLAIDGADEVDPGFQLIKGGGACHVREKLVASKANQLLIVVDETKLVQNLNQSFPLPVEVLPNAWKQVQEVISEMNGSSSLRMATKKAGPVVTDQGNLILDVIFKDGIKNPKDIEMKINNIPGVLENGLFVDLTDKVLVGKIEDNNPVVYSPSRAS